MMAPSGELLTRSKRLWCVCRVKAVWSIPGRFSSDALHLRRYTNVWPLHFTFSRCTVGVNRSCWKAQEANKGKNMYGRDGRHDMRPFNISRLRLMFASLRSTSIVIVNQAALCQQLLPPPSIQRHCLHLALQYNCITAHDHTLDKCKKLNSLKQCVRTTCFSHKT